MVTQTDPEDPFRPQVKLIKNAKGETLETPLTIRGIVMRAANSRVPSSKPPMAGR